MRYFCLLSVFALVGFTSCLKEKTIEPIIVEPGPCSDTVSFTNFIMPEIIDASCNTMGCHDQTGSGGYILINHNQVSTNANVIYSAISHEAGFTPMPLGQNKISDTLIQKFDCWIQQGTLNN